MQKRLFIALPFPKDALKILQKFRDEMGRLTPYARWTPAGNLHVTLLFLGNVEESALESVASSLCESVRETPPLSLTVRRAVYAPQDREPNMIWLQFEDDPAFSALADMQAKQFSSFLSLAASAHTGERPHITLARFKRTVEPHRLIRLRRTGLEDMTLSFSSCLLMESQLTASGPIYREITECVFMK